MQTDAMNAGVNPGGLNSKVEIRVLICYILANIKGAVPLEAVKEQLHFGGLANYFETALAISDLTENRTITCTEENGIALYSPTTESDRVSSALGSSLPFSVKEKALIIAENIITRRKNERNNKVEIEKADLGFIVTCKIMEKDYSLASISLLVPDEQTALDVKGRFLSDPISTLVKATEALTGADI